MPELKKKRDVGIDVAKGLAMFLVVFIHVRAYAPASDVYQTPAALENFCTIAALPLFLMMSGLFSRRLFAELSVRRLLLRMIACLWPVLTMIGVIGLVVRVLLGMPLVPPGGLLSYLMSTGWFFFCLVLCESMTFASCWMSRGRRALLAGFLVSGYILLWAMPFGMFHAVEMLPFYWFGVFLLPRLREDRFAVTTGLMSLAIYIVTCCVTGDFRQLGLNFHLTSMHLAAFSGRGLALMVGRIALGFCGGYGLMMFVRLAVSQSPALGRLANLGAQTLGVFFIHILLLAVYYGCGCWYGGGLLGRTALSVAILLVSFALVKLINSNRWIRALVWNPFVLFKSANRTKVR